MKEKRMNCETARDLCIITTLAGMGYFPQHQNKREAWFLSPFRKETQASFKVSKTLNRWYDHGEGIGGNLIDLMVKLTGATVSEVLEILDDGPHPIVRATTLPNIVSKPRGIMVTEVGRIQHPALIEYLIERRIPVSIARNYLKEVHFEMGNHNYFALGMKNDKGGWELRNSFQKLCSSPKGTILLKNEKENLVVVEGMFDFLSLRTMNPDWLKNSDILILNSLAFVKRVVDIMDDYKKCRLLLDNDEAGNKATFSLLKQHGHFYDSRDIIRGSKDLNDELMKRKSC